MSVQPRNTFLSANGWFPSGILFVCAMLIVANSRAALGVVVSAGSTTVNSIGHSFQPPRVDPINGPQPGVVTDFLIDQAQNVGGGAVLPIVALNLDTGSALSHKVQAPAGEHFQVNLPAGALSSEFSGFMRWEATLPPFGSGTGFGTSQTFENLTGIAPVVNPFGGAVADGDNGWFQFSPTSPSLHSFAFSAVTYETTYSARSLGLPVFSYFPTTDSILFFSYTTNSTTDPGRFVTIVPEPPSLTLLGIAGVGLIACLHRRVRRAT